MNEQEKKPVRMFGTGDDKDLYDCNIDDSRIEYTDSYEYYQHGERYGNQLIKLDGEIVGTLFMHQPYSILSPMNFSFMVAVDERMRGHPNYLEEEWEFLHFPNLQEFLDFVFANLDYVREIINKEAK